MIERWLRVDEGEPAGHGRDDDGTVEQGLDKGENFGDGGVSRAVDHDDADVLLRRAVADVSEDADAGGAPFI